ncbi:hypothetical protein [[Flexibacter] sp. ATCC 35103]|uniref:hypothetical protein n=1 Tax=[Flexibacter] sp. ATCC 35103 TaxID=1937528 RepID=UPI0009CCF164|nr:hypothetical protein [[Flexibacter] sp. ATCC 35103]OMQ09420.1 hypothetical protein BXU01_17470 [[Flexibacter] sp. ATCC 35103]
MTKIILGNHSEESENTIQEIKKENTVKPNLFQGRTESESGNAKFPDWDIVPPNQFINPRIKP